MYVFVGIKMNNRELAHGLDELDRLVTQLYAQVSNDPSPESDEAVISPSDSNDLAQPVASSPLAGQHCSIESAST